MTNRPPYDSDHRAEQLYRAAEIKAACVNPDNELQSAYSDPLSDKRLVSLAARELERRAVRSRYLPAEFSCDVGWSILLDILICESHAQPIHVAGSASRWKMSETTAVRQIAGLIEMGLIIRVAGQNLGDTAILRLTDHGREVLKQTLLLLD
ncbi:hypothetical protein [Erythrobacter sp.]|uniref:hypothetical protein n=1 Tax=Erythrobacter sp. TaxID=1042 RepID=UPI0025F5FAF9|nr:hypothetical protein [Erythrobacter sp.]